jgi:hypothetical protein
MTQPIVWLIKNDYTDSVVGIASTKEIAEAYQNIHDEKTYIEDWPLMMHTPLPDLIYEGTIEDFHLALQSPRHAVRYEDSNVDAFEVNADGSGTFARRVRQGNDLDHEGISNTLSKMEQYFKRHPNTTSISYSGSRYRMTTERMQPVKERRWGDIDE